MSSRKTNTSIETFPQRLEELRLKTESLPEEQRLHFQSAIDWAERV